MHACSHTHIILQFSCLLSVAFLLWSKLKILLTYFCLLILVKWIVEIQLHNYSVTSFLQIWSWPLDFSLTSESLSLYLCIFIACCFEWGQLYLHHYHSRYLQLWNGVPYIANTAIPCGLKVLSSVTHFLAQWFSTFARPRLGKLFFYKTARSQQIYS